MSNYSTTIEVEKTAGEVFNCIRDVSKWWNRDDYTGASSKLNDEFVICHPGAHYSKQKLVEVIPDNKIVWLVTDSKLDWIKDEHEWTDTKMVFDITAKGGHTVLRFTHEGLVPEKECYAKCEEGWNMVVRDRLFNYIAFGKTI